MEKYNKQKAILTALLKWVETEFFGIFVFLFFIAVAKPFGALANIIFGLTGLLTVVCLMADFGLKQGEEARNKVTFHGENDCPNYGFTLGLIASIPCYITMILLMISKISGSFNFMPAYKLLDACFYPLRLGCPLCRRERYVPICFHHDRHIPTTLSICHMDRLQNILQADRRKRACGLQAQIKSSLPYQSDTTGFYLLHQANSVRPYTLNYFITENLSLYLLASHSLLHCSFYRLQCLR